MAKRIMMTPELLRQRAAEIRTYRQTHMEVMSRMTNLVGSVCTVWQGSAQDAFVAKYMGMQPTFTDFQTMLDEFASLAQEAADKMERADTGLAQSVNAKMLQY